MKVQNICVQLRVVPSTFETLTSSDRVTPLGCFPLLLKLTDSQFSSHGNRMAVIATFALLVCYAA